MIVPAYLSELVKYERDLNEEQSRVEPFLIFKKLVFPISSRILRILTVYIKFLIKFY